MPSQFLVAGIYQYRLRITWHARAQCSATLLTVGRVAAIHTNQFIAVIYRPRDELRLSGPRHRGVVVRRLMVNIVQRYVDTLPHYFVVDFVC